MNIRVRREVIRCSKCKNDNTFFYLSDFSYGQRLINFDGYKQYAYINILEDTIYEDFKNMVKNILEKHKCKLDYIKISYEMFGITCDEIMGNEVDFIYKKKKCSFCSSSDFEDIMVEPAMICDIEVTVITHQKWEVIGIEKREKIVEKELLKRKIIQ